MDNDDLIPDFEEMGLVMDFRPEIILGLRAGIPVRIAAPGGFPRNNDVGREQIARIKWILGIFPLPIVDYALLWRRNRPQNLRHAVTATILSVFTVTLRIIRWLLYFVSLGHYAQSALRFFIMFASLATFSDNALVDIYSYVMRDYPTLLERKAILLFDEKNPARDSVFHFVADTLAKYLNASCGSVVKHVANGDVIRERWCYAKQDTLIFSFSKVFETTIPLLSRLPTPFLTSFTVVFYVMYGLVAQVVGFNVIFFFMLLMGYRMNRFIPFFIRFSKSAWKGLLESVL